MLIIVHLQTNSQKVRQADRRKKEVGTEGRKRHELLGGERQELVGGGRQELMGGGRQELVGEMGL